MKEKETAFEAELRENRDNVYRLAYRLTGNREDALEVTQETFLAAYRFRHRFRGESKVSTYLHRIAANVSFTLLKKRKQRAAWPLEASGEEPAGGLNPAQALDKLETAERIRKNLELLPPRQKAALHLRLYEEMPFEEIARVLGCRPSTARTLYFFGIRKLRSNLSEKNDSTREKSTGKPGRKKKKGGRGKK